MKKLLSLGIAVVGCAAIFAAPGSAAAKDHQYCRRDITSYMLQCGFDSLAQCEDMSSGRRGNCMRNPQLGSAAAHTLMRRVSARPTPMRRSARNNRGSMPPGPLTASVMARSKSLREG
jgi:hypothetical protein